MVIERDLLKTARCLKRTDGVVGAHGSRLYFVQLRTWDFLGRHYQLLGVAVIDTEDRCFIQRCLRSHRSGFGLETAFQHELHVIVTVRLNVLREPTQQTIQHATLFVLHRGYRRTASCLGLSGNRSSQIIHSGLQSCLVKRWCRCDSFIDKQAIDDSSSYRERLGIGQLLEPGLYSHFPGPGESSKPRDESSKS